MKKNVQWFLSTNKYLKYFSFLRLNKNKIWNKLFKLLKYMKDIKEPIDLINHSIGERIRVKCRGDRELKGRLHVL